MTRRRPPALRPAVLAVATALLVAAPAHAGGWASTSFSPPPADQRAGVPWVVELNILQHGQTPLTGIEPAVITTGPDGRKQRFDAVATAEPGVYRAEVVFSRPGRHRYAVDDGFGNAVPVTYPPVEIAPRAGAPAAGRRAAPPPPPGFPWELYLPAVAILAVLGGVAVMAARHSGARPV